jgi:peptide-methionine (R)-S-oxide reductase
VLRTAPTETPFSSLVSDEHRPGIFGCAGCAHDLFSSTTKFDSGTGWPSFWKDNAVIERHDNSRGVARTEVLCRRCGGRLIHVFNYGPEPIGRRNRMNDVALGFRSL